MPHKKTLVISLIVLITLFMGCQPKEVLPEDWFKGFIKPEHFPATVYNFENNPITKEKFELGKQLFYDVRLSGNNTISCASCHIQSNAFAQFGHPVSHGVEDRLGKRNSQALMNLAWMPAFMWDGGVADLDLQPMVPISAHEEMDMRLDELLLKLKEIPEYTAAFEKGFGTPEITTARLLKALSQFMVMCVTADSKYDEVMLGKAEFSAQEQRGYQFFQANCNTCHKEPLFSDFSFRNNGLVPGVMDDKGRYDITLNEADKYTFKVPSLRNLSLTAPYMHDGRLNTLEEVLDHYDSELDPGTGTLDPALAGPGKAVPMTPEEKTDLLAFLQTLTDRVFISRSDLAE